MKIPKTFLPENKNLEEKLKQLEEEPKTQKQNYYLKIEKAELDKALENICNVRDHEVFSEIRPLLGKTGYTLMKRKKRYEYWCRPAGFDEKQLFIRLKGKNEHYAFSVVEENNMEKFCQKFEYERKQIPLNVFLTTIAVSASTTLLTLPLFYFKNYFKNGAVMVPISGTIIACGIGVYFLENLLKYIRKRNKRNTEKYCLNIITNDEEALKAALN